MKLKYYLRGLGIGIVVSVCVLSVAFGNRAPMTDAEIKARATELGMIENTVIKDMANKEENVDAEGVASDADNTENEDTEIENTEIKDNTEPEQSEEPENNTEDKDEEPVEPSNEQNEGSVTITVVGGDSSWSVSKRMEEAGLIESASEFDAYLCQNGYDKSISVGTYEIEMDSSFEDMAKIITRKK